MSPPSSEPNAIPEASPKKILGQTLWIWFFTILAIRALHELRRVPWVQDNLMLLTGLVLIYVPILILWRRRERLDFFEKSWIRLAQSLFWFLIAAAVIFPLIEILNRYFQEIAFHRRYVGGNYRGLGEAALFQILLVGLPEEFFYRGFMQDQLNRVWLTRVRFLGAPIGWSLLVTSLLFALSHSLITIQWWHFSIFFPSLVFGWLRDKTGAITASALFHALCNVYSMWVALNYRPM